VIALHRSVLPDDKPLALGVTSLLTRGLGVIPSQILFAAVFDSSCLHWSAGQCDKGFCQVRRQTGNYYKTARMVLNYYQSKRCCFLTGWPDLLFAKGPNLVQKRAKL